MFESVLPFTNGLGYAPEMLWDWFAARDYLVLTPDRVAHDAPALSREVFLDAHHYPYRTHNFFAVASEKRLVLRDKARTILGIVPR